jgi:hypothetical protein
MIVMNKRTTTTANRLTLMLGASLLTLAAACNTSQAYERYNSGCQNCHGSFLDSTSPQGTVFPSDDKHRMHRNSANMGTDCALCHRSDDNDNPFIGSSDGIGGVPGLGCTGCHVGSGLRRHHQTTGTPGCYSSAGCHGTVPETAPAENVSPPYYGTAYTKAMNPGNTVLAANTNENWSVDDLLGLDNDGNNLYDVADFAIGGRYRILSTTKVGNDVRITWQTAGGRKDAIQASDDANGVYSKISSTITNVGVGVVTTNYLDVGTLTSGSKRFYRVVNVP